MAIVSLSVPDDFLSELDSARLELGFKGRSETIRAALRAMLSDKKQRASLKGHVDAVMLVVHDDHDSQAFLSLRHKYGELVKTQLHNHLRSHKCLELLLLSGDARDITSFVKDLETSKKIDLVKLVVP